MDVKMVDSHAHLAMFEPAEIEEILDRARAAGVCGVIVPATGADDLDRVAGLANEYPETVVAALGVHPHEASSLDAGLKARLERSLDRPGIVAVGEIGLDYHYMSSPREDQLRALEWQLGLAASAGLPVILHNRESWEDMERVLSSRAGDIRGVCHSFAETPDAARFVVAIGLKVGISGMVTFKNGGNVREIVRVLAPGDLLVETDSPYLAPTPNRGKRNEPAYVVLTALRVAEELGIALDTLADTTTGNVRELFNLDPAWPGTTA
ncbi:MAG: TatD family hydrolase [Acidobacteria bacterium]|nr:TatD family hydrolase [Acidobacteriota bacterium]